MMCLRLPISAHRLWPIPVPRLAIRLLICLLVILTSAGCSPGKEGEGQGKQQKRAAVAVSVATSSKKTLPVTIAATGHVEASATVEVRSQVTGTLKTVHFKEGDEVKAGELLFTIDPRPFAANLAKAEASLAKDKAELENAGRETIRYAQAAQKGYVSVEQADQAATRVATLTATVKADQAAVDAARLELEYCSIRAPFTGRTGEVQTDQGNLIKANADTPMLTLNQIQPLLAAFTVPSQHLQEIVRYRAAGTLKVLAGETIGAQEPLIGTLVFIDNTVDPATGVIRLKASFSDHRQRLWPGQLVDVRLNLTDRPDCIVVPSQAVQTGQNGAYVYVVRDDRTVSYRSVKPGMQVQGETVIESGLQENERVVIDGQLQLADGSRIEEREQVQTESTKKNAAGGDGSIRGKQ
jgi:membrane fusion protein, multidrug efflux system